MDQETLTRFEASVELLRELSRHSEELVYVVHLNNKLLEKLFTKLKEIEMGPRGP